jgi:membrane protease YdiL (CAAX protease family)
VFFVIMGLVAAIPEETIFRGILQPTLQRKLGRWTGLVVGALVFAVYHFMFRWPALLGKIGSGLVFGTLRERTGTLWAPAIAHALTWAVLGSL